MYHLRRSIFQGSWGPQMPQDWRFFLHDTFNAQKYLCCPSLWNSFVTVIVTTVTAALRGKPQSCSSFSPSRLGTQQWKGSTPVPVVSHSDTHYNISLFYTKPYGVIWCSPRMPCTLPEVRIHSNTPSHTPPGQKPMWTWTCIFHINGHGNKDKKTVTQRSKQGYICKIWMGLCYRGVKRVFVICGARWHIYGVVWEGVNVPSMSLTNLKSLACLPVLTLPFSFKFWVTCSLKYSPHTTKLTRSLLKY